MTLRLSRLPFLSLSLAATLASSWAFAATPPEAGEPHPIESAPAPPQVVAHAGAVVNPGLGATGAIDVRVVSGFHLGVQGGFFSDDANGYPFGGARASYRFAPTKVLRIVPTIGIAHV